MTRAVWRAADEGRLSELSTAERYVLLVLADFSQIKSGGLAYPGIARIANRTALTPRYIRTVLKRLESAGFIKLVSRGGGRVSSRYRILLDPGPQITPDAITGGYRHPISPRGNGCEKPGPRISRATTSDVTSPERFKNVYEQRSASAMEDERAASYARWRAAHAEEAAELNRSAKRLAAERGAPFSKVMRQTALDELTQKAMEVAKAAALSGSSRDRSTSDYDAGLTRLT